MRDRWKLAVRVLAGAFALYMAYRIALDIRNRPASIPAALFFLSCFAAYMSASLLKTPRTFIQNHKRAVQHSGVALIALAHVWLVALLFTFGRYPNWKPPISPVVLAWGYMAPGLIGVLTAGLATSLAKGTKAPRQN